MRVETVSSPLAPISLIAGFELGGSRQPGSYDPVRETISALAARGATDRWIMSSAFVALGLCHLVTASGVRRPLVGRVLLAVGGITTALLAAAPQPAHGSSDAHLVLAAIALISLALWPLAGMRVERLAGVVLVGLLIWFGLTLQSGTVTGLAERVLTVAEALWPIGAVALARRVGTAEVAGTSSRDRRR